MTTTTKWQCACGSVMSVYSIPRHLSSKVHLKLLEMKKELDNEKKCNSELKNIIDSRINK